MEGTRSPTMVAQGIVDNVSKVIVGKRPVIEHALAALIAQGHVLVEDVPGVGKTMLAKSLSTSIGCEFRRIQFTPDLLPSDVSGVSVYNQQSGDFQFRPGPIMSQVVLADEINRATPKTQSALLEAMEELQVTGDGVTHHLEHPFIVFATQNPIEYEGTFPLPEAQLDRFLLMITLGYPTPEQELAIVENQRVAHPIEALRPVTTPEEVIEVQEAVRHVYVDDLVKQYIVAITGSTRSHPDISLGSSPRGSLALFRGGQATAIVRGRDFVLPDDIKELAGPMISHRIIVSAAANPTAS